MACLSNLWVDLVCGFMFFLIACQVTVKGEDELYAICTIAEWSGLAPVSGTVKMHQKSGSQIQFDVNLKGFNRSTSPTQHGFHIHDVGDLGNKCNNCGGHYNPDRKTHGAPEDEERHVGDLGNILVDENGEVVNVTLQDRKITLFGDRTVIGRSFVVHEKVDDLGKGGQVDSNTTGHAGSRFGCCTIQQTTSGVGNTWSDVRSTVAVMLFLASSLISIY